MISSARRLAPARLSAVALLIAAGFALSAIGLSATPAAAQSSVENLNAKVERLQRELTDLQRAFYRQGGTTTGSGASSGEPGEGGGPATARLAVRISELETQVRSLTGEMEQLSFRVRQLSQQLETFSGDTEYRLQLLEKGTASVEPSEPVQTGSAASGGAAGQSVTATGTRQSPSQSRSLGQVRQSDVIELRQQSGSQDTGSTGASNSSGQAVASSTPATSGAYQLPEGAPEEQYRHAFGLLRQMKYDEAEGALRAFLQQNPDHRLAGNAKYWLGETYYVRGDFQSAAVAFAEGFKDYPDSNKSADNLLKLGISLGELGRTSDACGALAELLNRYPDLSQALRQRAVREQQALGCT
ncbi:MAG: tol-pal system protein YbgF [Rhodovibrionaceae bacterium]|nr:tol-pal system protein YbgF [Rhodovibrionaceae bacterium]